MRRLYLPRNVFVRSLRALLDPLALNWNSYQ
jgi:hypothetical protein